MPKWMRALVVPVALTVGFGLVALGWQNANLHGQGPMSFRGRPRQSQARPTQGVPSLNQAMNHRKVNYAVTPEAGPWMVCAASYMGPDAPELSRQLVVQLRERFRLPAYVFNYGDEQRRQQRKEWEKLKKRYPGVPLRRRTVRIRDQCAVLVGGYRDMESASKALDKIRKLPLPKLDLGPDKTAYDMMTVAKPDPRHQRMRVEKAPINPFTTAFVTRNPTVEFKSPERPKFDPFWKELNADEPYSVLKCPKRWTLVVKEYYGATVIKPQTGSSKFLKMVGFGRMKPGEGLSAAAKQAQELAKLLRNKQLGFEAYVMHTRFKSIVTVGGFDSLDDPNLLRTQQRLSQLKFGGQGRYDPIRLFRRPMPMEVPRF